MLCMVKPIYASDKKYKVIERLLPGDSLDEKLDSMKKGRTVIATMALSLYKLDGDLKNSIVKATGIKVVGASAKGVKTPKHVTDDNMKLLLHNYAKKAMKNCSDKIYKGILEQYSDVKTDTNLSNSPLKEYSDYMEILVSWFGLPEQFHKVETLKLENDGTYTVTFTDISDFVTKEQLEQEVCEKDTRIERLERELAEANARADKAEKDKRKAEELVKADLFATGDPLAVKVDITYSSSYQIGVGANSPADKVQIHPLTLLKVPLFTNAFNELYSSSQDDAIQYLANSLPQGGSLEVKAKYEFGRFKISLEQVIEQSRKAQQPTLTLDSNTK